MSIFEDKRTNLQSLPMNNTTPEPNPGVRRLGQLIRDLRLSRGETQQQLGAILGSSHAAFSDIELGKTNLTVKDLVVIANHFGVSTVGLIEKAYALPSAAPEPELNVEAERLPDIVFEMLNYARDCGLRGELMEWPEKAVPFIERIQQVSDQRVQEFSDLLASKRVSIKPGRGEPAHDVVHWADIRQALLDYLSHKEARNGEQCC